MSTRTWATGTAGTSSLADVAAVFHRQAEQLAELADTITAALTPDRATLDALADLARAVRTASRNPRRLRHLLRSIDHRRSALHAGLAAVADAVSELLDTGAALLFRLSQAQRCRQQRTGAPAAHHCAPIAVHLAAHAPPAGTCFYVPTCPEVL